jgi:hypothetical protein
VFYIITGLWPLISMRSFELVTGPKVDDWLVRMVALLTVTIGIALLLAARRSRIAADVLLLAVGTPCSFAVIDIVYATSRRISPIYLLDAVVEIALALIVWVSWWRLPPEAQRPE